MAKKYNVTVDQDDITSIATSIVNIPNLNDVGDVDINSLLNDQVLTYDSNTQRWKNESISVIINGGEY